MPCIAIVSSNISAGDVLDPRPGRRAGDAARLRELGTALAGLQHDVRLYAVRDDPALPEGRRLGGGLAFRTVETGDGAAPEAGAAGWLATHWALGDWAPDVVHALGWRAGRASISAARDRGAAVIQAFGGAVAADAERARISRALGRLADRVVVGSGAELETLVRWGVPRGRISHVPPGVDPVRFHPSGPVAPRSVDVPRLLVVGRPAPQHGHADLAAALRLVPGAECVALGAEADDAAWLAGVAAAAGVADRFVAVPPVPPADLPAWYRSADVVVCPARTPTRHAPVLEAMASGVPIVATAVGGLVDAVVDGLTGDLVAAGSPRALGAAIRRMLRDDVRRMSYATAALDRARHCYSWTRCATQLAGVYTAALPAAAAPDDRIPAAPDADRAAAALPEPDRAPVDA
ncbi:glycosyl transferase [Pilimelia anulata]|uniref:Glycosyl transferase n=1 Tax=Pilimelia anulata TaxID=53371 RepID=A0A8J3B994_9ACTN|nr:glycosyltransferase [Pilimelia anulata]GGJ86067.1 glycosyl transferase [Pilimelia anulata]